MTGAAPLRLGVLVSGRGSNLQALLDAGETRRIDAQVAVVVSDTPGAPALKRLEGRGIPGETVARASFADAAAFEESVAEKLEACGVELVVLAGFMRVLSPFFIRRFAGRIVNVHPSLLPAFPGLHAQRQALEHGVKVAGCTVHFVDESLDGGPIVAQAAVPVLPEDTEDSLSARILEEEHRLLPEVVGWYADGLLEVCGRRVEIKKSK